MMEEGKISAANIKNKLLLIIPGLEWAGVFCAVLLTTYVSLNIGLAEYKLYSLWVLFFAFLCTTIFTFLRRRMIDPFYRCLLCLERNEPLSSSMVEMGLRSAFKIPGYISLTWIIDYFTIMNASSIVSTMFFSLPRTILWWNFCVSLAGMSGFGGVFYVVSRTIISPGLRQLSLEAMRLNVAVLPKERRGITFLQIISSFTLALGLNILIAAAVYFYRVEVTIPQSIQQEALQVSRFLSKEITDKLAQNQAQPQRIEELVKQVRFENQGIDFLIRGGDKEIIWSKEKQLFLPGQDRLKARLFAGIDTGKAGGVYDGRQRRVLTYLPILNGKYILGRVVDVSAQQKDPHLILILLIVAGLWGTFTWIVLPFYFGLNVTQTVNKMKSILQEMARGGGDLTFKIPVGSNDELGEISVQFNRFLLTFKDIISHIRSAADKVNSSSQGLSSSAQQMNSTIVQISSSIQQVSKGVVTQSQKVEESRKIMEKIAIGAKQAVENARGGAEYSKQAAEQAEGGGKAVQEVVEKMDRIAEVVSFSTRVVQGLGEKSIQIGEITETITKIADQTNLLALNAAIEAARAGESGHGFAVVAEEVRKLAESSANAATDIGNLIKSIQTEAKEAISSIEKGNKEVEVGKEVVSKARQAFEKIINAVHQIAERATSSVPIIEAQLKETERGVKAIDEIASIAEQSSSVAQEVTSSTEEATASMEEMAASAQDLAKMAGDLRELVGKFKIEEKS